MVAPKLFFSSFSHNFTGLMFKKPVSKCYENENCNIFVLLTMAESQ